MIEPRPMFGPRGPKWSYWRAVHLTKNPRCAACGGDTDLEVHHIEPYHLFPAKEYDLNNMITLCMHPSRLCHFVLGHVWDWHNYNTDVTEMAARMLSKKHTKLEV